MDYACNGFFRAAEKEVHRKINLDEIRNVAESHLFNFLFIRYCESKHILPMKNGIYRQISLSNIIDKLEEFDPEKEEEINIPILTRAFSKNYEKYNPKGTELYDQALHLVESGFKYEN